MVTFTETLLFSAIMGLSIYISLPLVLRKRMGEMKKKLLLAIAIGILVFLMGDVFSDVTPDLYNGSLNGYGTSFFFDTVFIISLVAGFFLLFLFESRSKTGLTPVKLSLLIALGIGLQNLTEGLVFGSLGATLGLTGVTLVVLIGFTFQNVTEGFPIASPFLGRMDWKIGVVLALFLVGGLPTILGGALGYFYSSTVFDVIFDGLAIGSILYVILPMLKVLFRETDLTKQRIAYAGIFVGFAIGFAVNLL
jgi:zinc transporter, ZIP family